MLTHKAEHVHWALTLIMAAHSTYPPAKMCKTLWQTTEDSSISLNEIEPLIDLPTSTTLRALDNRLRPRQVGYQTHTSTSSSDQLLPAVLCNVIRID